MKATKHIFALLGILCCLAVCIAFVGPTKTYAQGMPSWWGSDRIWDWSDFRMNLGLRLFMPNLRAGTAKFGTREYDMLGSGNFSFQPQPDYFKEGWFILYIDRLALRAHFEEDHRFRGVVGRPTEPTVVTVVPPYTNPPFLDEGRQWLDPSRTSDLDVGWTRFGLDLDLVRYPFLRAGINFDRHFEPVIYIDRQGLITLTQGRNYIGGEWRVLTRLSDGVYQLTTRNPPVTIGVHAFASPGRIRGIPVVAQARFRMPAPLLTNLLQDNAETRIIDWEVYVGLRPNIWNTSLYGYNTFAMGIEAGFRSSYVDMSSGDGVWQIKAHWQGPFVQVGLYY